MKTISMLAAAALTLSAALSFAPAHAADAVPTTRVTLEMPGCDGCIVGVASYLYGTGSDAPLIWDDAKPKKVVDGEVTFAVPTDRTPGLSITVPAPWEGATGYVTNVVLRYKGETGDHVGFTTARAAKRGPAAGRARPTTPSPSRWSPARSWSPATAPRSPAPLPTPRSPRTGSVRS